ncbi:hypothetical protein JST56_03990 [Candidatus Dependentiae bacterium]|nr:hypothetical protein [Candidatus Dependentiae bacterium]
MKRALHAIAYSLIMASALCMAPTIHAKNLTEKKNSKKEQSNIYFAVKNHYLPAIANTAKAEKKASKELNAKNADLMVEFEKKGKYTVNSLQIPQVGHAEKINLMYSILATSHEGKTSYPNILNSNIFNDLEMLAGNAPDFDRNIFSKIDYTLTTAGKVQLQKMLYTPTADIKELVKRQQIIKQLVNKPALRKKLEAKLLSIKQVENELIWFWKEIQVEIASFFEEAYFQKSFLKSLNKNEYALEAESIRTFVFPVINILMGNIFLAASFKLQEALGLPADPMAQLRWHAGMLAYMGFALSIQYAVFGINVFAPAVNQYNICDTLQKKMINIASYMNNIKEIGSIINTDSELSKLLPDAKNFVQSGVTNAEAKELLSTLQSGTFEGEASFFSNYGRVLAAFKTLQDAKNNVVNALGKAGDIDAYVALARLYKKHASHPDAAQYCFVDFQSSDKPYLKAEEFWHPMLKPSTVVTNNLELGTADAGRNLIITGPNAGGKSTSLKAITLCVWLAQSIGIAPARALSMTPFTKINTYLNITDSEGRESLFQAEMHRAQALLESIKSLNPSEFSFVIMDEIFTGTNPKEGEAAAYGVAKHISSFDNNMTIVATHFKELTNLEATTNGLFKNFKVSVIKTDGGFIYPYKLESGISDQPIALQLLANQGFAAEILHEAHAIMAKHDN